jgi:hypothetical protein
LICNKKKPASQILFQRGKLEKVKENIGGTTVFLKIEHTKRKSKVSLSVRKVRRRTAPLASEFVFDWLVSLWPYVRETISFLVFLFSVLLQTFPLCNAIERISKGMFALFLIALVLFCYASVIFLHLALVTEIPVFMTIIIQADNG